MKHKISVLIPCYNGEKYIQNCISSIKCSCDVDIEIVIVDDGSVDSTPNVCAELCRIDDRIKYIRQENGGVSVARNTALDNATGDYIVFCDADDLIADGGLDALYKAITTYNCDIVSSIISIQRSNMSEIHQAESDAVNIYEKKEDILKLCLNVHYDSIGGKIYKRNILSSIRFEAGRKINEDVFFVFQCLTQCAKVAEIEQVTYRYLYYNNSVSRSSFSEKHYDILYFMDLKLKYFDENLPHLHKERAAVALRHLIQFFLKYVRSDASKESKKEIRKKIFANRKGASLCSKRERILCTAICYFYPIFRYRYRKKR